MESKFTLILGELNHALNNWSWGIYSVKLEVVSGGKFACKLQTTGKVENLHAHVNRNLKHANPNLHVL